MAVAFISRLYPAAEWVPAIERCAPELDIRVWPEVGDRDEIDVALVHNPPPGALASLPRLRAILSLTAGVDGVLADPNLPEVPLARVVSERLGEDMAHYVVLHTLRHVRHMPAIAAHQRARRWGAVAPPVRGAVVGLMGLGEMGRASARLLAAAGFAVRGWSRSARSVAGIACFAGSAGLAPFLGGATILVCLLPLTPKTHGIVNATTLAALPAGACFINAGRGAHVVEADLLDALDSGRLAGATLDVLAEQPPPEASPVWTHPGVTLTMHSAGEPDPSSVAPLLIENIRRARSGRPLLNLIDREQGY